MPNTHQRIHRIARQRGAALFVALAFLLLLTLLALTASSTSVLEEKMAGSQRSAQLARFGADTAARGAESLLWNASESTEPFVVCGSKGLFNCYSYRPSAPIGKVEDFRKESGWITSGATAYKSIDLTNLGTADATANLAAKPVYIIEDLGIERPPGVSSAHESGATGSGGGAVTVDKHVYRVTARSTGGTQAVVRGVSTVFAAKSN